MTFRTIEVALRANVAQFQAQMGAAGASVKSFGSGINDTLSSTDKKTKQSLETVSRGALLMGGALVAGFGVAVGAAARFDKAMSGVSAVSGATAGEMKLLGEAALKAGEDTVFSATEAAQAQAELVKAGISVSDVLGGALTGSLALAAAGQLDLKDAAEIAAQSMNVFGLSGKDVTHIADVLAAGANKSAADVGQLGEALRQGGLVAAQTGLSFEETVGALSAFADNALIGSDAGTSLKTMLQRLTPQSEEAASLMQELGFSAYDAQGNFIGLEGLAGELQTSLAGMTVEQRNSAMATLFGSDAVRAANILYKEGAPGIREYVTAVNDQGAAFRMANELTNNLAGDVERLGGALETALIRSGSSANGVLRGIVQTAEGAVSAFGNLPGPVLAGGTALVGLSGSVLLVLGGVGSLIPKVHEARTALSNLGTAGATANDVLGKLGKAAGIAGLVTTVAIALHQVGSALFDLNPDLVKLQQGLLDLGKSNNAAAILKELETDVDGFRSSISLAAEDISGFAGAFRGFVDPKGVMAIDEARQKIEGLDQSLAALVGSAGPEIAEQVFRDFAASLGLSNAEIDALRPQLDAFNGALAENKLTTDAAAAAHGGATDAMRGANEVMGESVAVTEEQKAASEALQKVYDDVSSSIMGFTDPMDAYRTALEANTEAARNEGQAALDRATQVEGANATAGKSWEDYATVASVSLNQVLVDLNKQDEAFNNWADNLATIAARGRGDLAIELAKLGPEAAPLVQAFSDETGAIFNETADAWIRNTRRGQDGSAEAIVQGSLVQQEFARQGANATVETVAAALDMLPLEVERIVNETNQKSRDGQPAWNESWASRTRITLAEMETVKNEAPPKAGEAVQTINQYLADNYPAFVEQMASRRGVTLEEMNVILRDAPPIVRQAFDQFVAHARETQPPFAQSFVDRSAAAVREMAGMRSTVPPIVGGTFDDMTGAANSRLPGFAGAVGGYQNTLLNGVKTVSGALSPFLASRGPGPITAADGAIVEFYAQGGMKEKHQAQIARAGDWRVWAEPETGGEAYIPLSWAKRERSTAILEEVARRFGLSVRDMKDLPEGVDYHDGGLYIPPPHPQFSDFGTPMRPGGSGTTHNMQEATAEWARRHMKEPHHQAPPPGSGGGGGLAGGKALDRVRSVIGEFAGARVTSTYRSPAQNAAVGGAKNSLHMDKNNPAVDIGGPTGVLDRMNARLRGMGGWRELLWRVKGHYDHIHAAEEGLILNSVRSFDKGGLLHPGWTLAHNGTGFPERVVNFHSGGIHPSPHGHQEGTTDDHISPSGRRASPHERLDRGTPGAGRWDRDDRDFSWDRHWDRSPFDQLPDWIRDMIGDLPGGDRGAASGGSTRPSPVMNVPIRTTNDNRTSIATTVKVNVSAAVGADPRGLEESISAAVNRSMSAFSASLSTELRTRR